jgi:hypothetical protein
MRDGPQRTSAFPTAHCAACDRVVLTHVIYDNDAGQRRCVHCDGPVGADLRWISAGALEAEGYYFGPPPAAEDAAGGCTTGCGTCATRRH